MKVTKIPPTPRIMSKQWPEGEDSKSYEARGPQFGHTTRGPKPPILIKAGERISSVL